MIKEQKNPKISWQLKEEIAKAVSGLYPKLKLNSEAVSLEHPTREEHGDYSSNISLILAKRLNENPRKIAEKLVEKLDQSGSENVVEKVEIAGPGFINFTLTKEKQVKAGIEEVLAGKEKFGSGDWGSGKKWLIEHTSPNPNKAMHLGHLRNNVTGMAIANLWEFSGVKVYRDDIDNNRGIAIAKLMWGFLKFGRKDEKNDKTDVNYWFDHQDEWLTPEEKKIRPDRFVDELYTAASKDFEDHEVEEKVRKLVVDWERHDEKNWALWKKVLDYSYQGQQMTLARLGNKWDKVWHEHEHYQMGKDIVEEGLKKGVFRKTDDGAILTNLETYGLPDTVVIKRDGTALYITQDLALTKLKRETFKPDKIHWVIGPEQSLALKQMFAVCEQLGIGKIGDYVHIAFGYMSIKGKGKMSSRSGNVVYIDELLDEAKKEVETIMKASNKGGEFRDEISEKVAVGAVKYSVLKVGRLVDTAFDFETSLSFDGDSGPYLQYTYARARSVLRKAVADNFQTILSDKSYQFTNEELAILRWLYRFPEMVEMAARQYAPNIVCSYLFELAKRFNNFYNNVQILKGESGRSGQDEEYRRNFRLALTAAVGQVLKNGLNLLGIEALERM